MSLKSELKFFPLSILYLGLVVILVGLNACSGNDTRNILEPRISTVNSPQDIVTLGAQFIAEEIKNKSNGAISPVVYHSGMLSGGKGSAEIEMCQQGSIHINITSTAYLANLVPEMSMVSLPFLFRDLDQVIGFVTNDNPVFERINRKLHSKNLHILAWWPRGFRQITNSSRPIKTPKDLDGLLMRVMNNQLYVQILNAMHANPVPMEWGEVYNSLQLKTIDGQENAEDVIFSARLYEIQKYMTIWDYSIDLEVVLVNLQWWNILQPGQQKIIQKAADASILYESELLKANTVRLRKVFIEKGVEIYQLPDSGKQAFIDLVEPVWQKYRQKFSDTLFIALSMDLKKY